VRHHVRTAGRGLLAAILALGLPLGAAAQTTMTGSQQVALLHSALVHFDSETATLASMRNHIPSHEVVTVAVTGSMMTGGSRSTMARWSTRHAALQDALNKATVADVDRNNGQSEDQSSLAEYLQHLNIDPSHVVAVDVDPRNDPQNPRVTVFYRR